MTRKPNLALVAIRILVITLAGTIIAWSLALFFGIVGFAAANFAHGGGIDMRGSYLHVALPVAIPACVVAFSAAVVIEIRHYRRQRAAWQDNARAA